MHAHLHQAPPSMGFSRQECWSGLPCPTPGDLPNPGIGPTFLALAGDSLPLRHLGSPIYWLLMTKKKKEGDFPGGSDGKESACNVRDLASIPESGRSPGEGPGNPLQYSCLENSMKRSLVGYSPWGRKGSDMTE